MKITAKLTDEAPCLTKPSGGYEWWYFDAVSTDNEWSFVIIFYEGNPFSTAYIKQMNEDGAGPLPGQFPALSISLYRHGKPEFYSFVEYNPSDSEDIEGSIQIGHSFVKRYEDSELRYELDLDEKLPSGHQIKASFSFTSAIPNPDLISKSGENHIWNLIQPAANVSGIVNVTGKNGRYDLAFNGTGYHDHNTGLEPMKQSFYDWYWGRLHTDEFTLVYYLMCKQDKSLQSEAWLIDPSNQLVLDELSHMAVEQKKANRFGLESNRSVKLTFGNGTFRISSRALIDSGPFYLRFMSEFEWDWGNKRGKGAGFSEYIRPKRIYSRVFWPLVHMRIRYRSRSPHWVQKNKRLYEVTW
ncbi:MAG: hypothetical protein AAFW89_07240 [Bacteroidota bacterium]